MKKLFVFLPFLFACYMGKGQASFSVIGNPVEIGNILVAKNNFPKKMSWDDAKKACAKLGNGWRLPTKDELYTLYQNRDLIGGFGDSYCWSSTEYDPYIAWFQFFINGAQGPGNKSKALHVRAVKGSSTEPAKTATDVIGKPIKIENIEIAQYDFPNKMNWNEAKKVCSGLGEGWRLPTKEELNTLYKNAVAIGGFESSYYWSSKENTSGGNLAEVWSQNLVDGRQVLGVKSPNLSVRAVRGELLEAPKPQTDVIAIIGKPIKIGNLLVAQNDFPNLMEWGDAKNACAELGKGWRLPTKTELSLLNKSKDNIGGFAQSVYWSSTEIGGTDAWAQIFFSNGRQLFRSKSIKLAVRAIKTD
jgi:hypothetical protein